MGESDSSDVDVCTVDDDSTSSFVGLTVVAAETYIEQENKLPDLLVPLSNEDLLTREKEKKLKEVKLKALTGNNYNAAIKKDDELMSSSQQISKSNKEPKSPTLQPAKVNQTTKNVEISDAESHRSEAEKSSAPLVEKKNKRKFVDIDSEISEKDDNSDEELFDTGVDNSLKKFSFESDHLALKNNRDYHKLLQTLAVLEAQRAQAIKDYEELNRLKDIALEDPLDFVKKIQEKKAPEFPKRQQIAKLPEINWVHYMTAYTSDKYFPQITTRNTIKELEQETLENVAEFENYETSAMKEASEKVLRNLERHSTFNQKWSVEEQEKLEQLLVLFPPEEVEARRWEKIAKALGTRTPQQVSSRIQKYFIKLAKAKLPIPGRTPSATLLTAVKKKPNLISFKNSTFFPSWRPAVSMKEDGDGEFDDNVQFKMCDIDISDEEEIPEDLKETPEYKELMELKKIKKMQSQQSKLCDGCSMDPIVGVRWHCLDCPVNDSVDFCNNCVQRPISHATHIPEHELVPIHESVGNYGDNDYTKFEQRKFKYNYLDPNFLPS